jgi:hypothetical protein
MLYNPVTTSMSEVFVLKAKDGVPGASRGLTRERLRLTGKWTVRVEQLGSTRLFLVEDRAVAKMSNQVGFPLDVGVRRDAQLVGSGEIPTGAEASTSEREQGIGRDKVDESVWWSASD